MALKSDLRTKSFRETIALAVTVSIVTVITLSFMDNVREVPGFDQDVYRQLLDANKELLAANQRQHPPVLPVAGQKRLIFYNRPPKTGSTSVRVAMKKALDEAGLKAARCFNMIEWNEMALRTIINRRDVDFYGCHTRLQRDRYRDVADMRGGNVTFMTSTRDPTNIIFSAYLQLHRDRDIAGITDRDEMDEEIKRYKQHVESYPVNALYMYHGADAPLTRCPHNFAHESAMRRIAERYEIVVDLERPEESAAMVEIVTGLKPDFDIRFNERSTDLSNPMLAALSRVDTSSKSCGNALVHKVLKQQFNAIKDRLMQNRCFDEASGTYALCEKAVLDKATAVERTRAESFKERKKLQMAM